MANKDIYEHISDVYFSDKSKKIYKRINPQTLLLYVNTAVIFALFTFTIYLALNNTNLKGKGESKPLIVESKPGVFSIMGNRGPLELNYKLSIRGVSTDKFSIDLNDRAVEGFGSLALNMKAKTGDPGGYITLLIENGLGETGVYLLKGINKEWNEFVIPLDKFQLIKDVSKIVKFTLIFEDWNMNVKQDTVFIKDISFYK